ncbi:MAG: translocation/assembly module TamB [Bacteroidaceae bacterium]|nr:translocation/assembly module TamB [Bacteroidaceae bacterium]
MEKTVVAPEPPEIPEKEVKKKRGPMSRFLRWVVYVLLSPIVLFLILTILLYIPFVQDWAVGYACDKLSEETGMQVSVERLRIKFPLDVELQDLCVQQRANDTVLAVKSCVLDLDLCGLFGMKVGVDAFTLNDAVVDTHDLVATMKMRGSLDNFYLDAHDLEIKESKVNITATRLMGCDLDIALQDTVVIDTTTSEPTTWQIAFANVQIGDSRIAFHTANDTMSVRTGIENLDLKSGSFDLAKNVLQVAKLNLNADYIRYDQNYEPKVQGMDFNHLLLSGMKLSLPSIDYDLSANHLKTTLSSLCFKEKCGFQLDQLSADVELDATGIVIDDALLKTPTSQFKAWADVDWTALVPREQGGAVGPAAQGKSTSGVSSSGRMDVKLSANFSKQDVMYFVGEGLPQSIREQYPDVMLTAEVDITGNVDKVDVKSFRVVMPNMVDATVRGGALNLMAQNASLGADLDWEVHTGDLTLVKRMLGLTGFNLPAMDVTGNTHVAGDLYRADMQVRQGSGVLNVKGQYDMGRNAYEGRLDMNRFVVSRFVSMDSACVVSANADVKGSGFDFLSDHTQLRAYVKVPSAHYGSAECGKVNIDASLVKGVGSVNFYSGGDLVNADGCVEWMLRQHKVDSASFAFDMRGLDLYTLGVTKKPLKASMTMHMNGSSNFRDEHFAKGDITAIQLAVRDSVFYPRDISMEAFLTPDTTYAFLSAGDLLFRLNATDGLERLMEKGATYADSLSQQVLTKNFNRAKLIPLLPTVDLCVQSGQRNPMANILAMMTGYSYRELDIDLHTNPVTGIDGEGYLHTTNTGSIVLDTISFRIFQDSVGMNLDARVRNGKKNKDATFDARMMANITPRKVGFGILFLDANRKTGVDMGAQLIFSEGNKRLHLTPYRPVLAYRHFTLNEDNFFELKKDGRMDANLDLVADDGTGLKVYSTPNEDSDQDLTASVNRLNLGELCSVIPYMPRITGFLHGDLHYQQMQSVTSLMADLNVQQMTYEGCDMGNIGLNAAYMPNEDGTHYVDGFLTQNDDQVLSFNGLYEDLGHDDRLDANATFEHFPLDLANGFLDETVNLTGHLLGDVHVTGSTSKPRVDGSIVTSAMHVLSPMYSINMRIEDDSIQVAGSHLNINKLRAYTQGATPLTLDGVIDFYDLSHITLDVSAKAKNFELINAQKSRKVAAYGKVYVDLDARATGTTNNLNVTGKLGVLGNTSVTYVLLDSPITVEDEMADLVTFCDFSDTIEVEEPEFVPPSNLRMRINVSIDQGAMVHCLLSEDGVNYVKLEGGGDLVMSYDETRGMQMFGRYTILQGSMTYTLMLISLKDCVIKNGSYVEFSGDVGNPHLNISASERVNSSVIENETPRSVAFDVGIAISQTLNNMGLEFTLAAPEDMNVQNEIAQMTPEQRGRVAVTLMTTGMYLVEGGNGGGFNTANALNAFLQSQIATITGKALNSVDLSFGVANNATGSGSVTTDYSFRFAKRFWGNRISLIVGGKVSSGSEAVNTGQSIIDNVSIEYRLDKSATRYVTLYYDNNNESVLEGKIIEMGAGLVLRRKTERLGELFLFRTPKKKEETEE